MLNPPEMIMSLARPIRVKKPSASIDWQCRRCGCSGRRPARTIRPRQSWPGHCGSRSSSMPDRPTTSPGDARPGKHAVGADDTQIVARHRLAHRVELVRMLVGEEGTTAAALGRAVVFDQPARPAAQHLGLEVGRRTGPRSRISSGSATRSKAAKSDTARTRRYWTGTSIACVAPYCCAELEEASRVELRHQDDGAAAGERGQEADQRRVRIKRRRDHRDRIAAIAGWLVVRWLCGQRIAADWTMPLGVPVVPLE